MASKQGRLRRERDLTPAERAVIERLKRRTVAAGTLSGPCVPARLDHYALRIVTLFEIIDRPLSEQEAAAFREAFRERLAEGARASPAARFTFSYRPSESQSIAVDCEVSVTVPEPGEPVDSKTRAVGTFSGPCLPSLLEHYLAKLKRLFNVIDHPLTESDFRYLRSALAGELERGYVGSPYARLIFTYAPRPGAPLRSSAELSTLAPSLEEQYREWAGDGGGKPFGARADARALDLAAALTGQRGPILDVGAGTGRNALAVAELGFEVDALEPAPALARQLRALAAELGRPVSVLERDVLHPGLELSANRYRLIVMSEVATHFSPAELERLLPKLSAALAPGGTLLFNAFVADRSWTPEPLAREASQAVWAAFLTRRELDSIVASSSLELVREDLAIEYERTHLPVEAWPPTTWFENWASGHNLFAKHLLARSPMALYWLEYRRAPP
jgi:SAM-dependent methyltransferase